MDRRLVLIVPYLLWFLALVAAPFALVVTTSLALTMLSMGTRAPSSILDSAPGTAPVSAPKSSAPPTLPSAFPAAPASAPTVPSSR